VSHEVLFYEYTLVLHHARTKQTKKWNGIKMKKKQKQKQQQQKQRYIYRYMYQYMCMYMIVKTFISKIRFNETAWEN
jgi:hypothetical protein